MKYNSLMSGKTNKILFPTAAERQTANMYVKMYKKFCRHLYECWIW